MGYNRSPKLRPTIIQDAETQEYVIIAQTEMKRFGVGHKTHRGSGEYVPRVAGGKGVWRAESNEDAKQMAEDYVANLMRR